MAQSTGTEPNFEELLGEKMGKLMLLSYPNS